MHIDNKAPLLKWLDSHLGKSYCEEAFISSKLAKDKLFFSRYYTWYLDIDEKNLDWGAKLNYSTQLQLISKNTEMYINS